MRWASSRGRCAPPRHCVRRPRRPPPPPRRPRRAPPQWRRRPRRSRDGSTRTCGCCWARRVVFARGRGADGSPRGTTRKSSLLSSRGCGGCWGLLGYEEDDGGESGGEEGAAAPRVALRGGAVAGLPEVGGVRVVGSPLLRGGGRVVGSPLLLTRISRARSDTPASLGLPSSLRGSRAPGATRPRRWVPSSFRGCASSGSRDTPDATRPRRLEPPASSRPARATESDATRPFVHRRFRRPTRRRCRPTCAARSVVMMWRVRVSPLHNQAQLPYAAPPARRSG